MDQDARDPKSRFTLDKILRSGQGNWTHLSAFLKELTAAHNDTVSYIEQELETIADVINAGPTVDDIEDAPPVVLTGDHADLTNVTAGQHHAEDHDHDGSPTQKLLAANTHESPSEDTHHAKNHASRHLVGGGDALAPVYKTGAAATISDSDFAATPSNGQLAVCRDTSSGITSIWCRTNGAWESVEVG